MQSNNNEIKILNQLGLTVLEARIYLALCTYETLTAKAISKLTKTSQPDSYRVIPKLQNKGLIEKIIGNPAQFKAVPIEKSIAFLLEKKKMEYDGLKAQTEILLSLFKEKNPQKPDTYKNPHFVIIPKGKRLVNKVQEAIESSERKVDLYLPWKRFFFGMTVAFAESFERAWSRGVKFRLLAEKPEAEKDVEIAEKLCRKNPLGNIRFLRGHPKTVIGIYDNKEAFIVVHPKEGLFNSPALWSNNESFLTVVQDYFEILWLSAMETPQMPE